MRILHVHDPVPIQDAVVGTLGAVDDRRETITVVTQTGLESLTLPPSVLVHQGAHTLPVRELAAHADEPVKVWYRKKNGRRIVLEVRLADSSERTGQDGTLR